MSSVITILSSLMSTCRMCLGPRTLVYLKLPQSAWYNNNFIRQTYIWDGCLPKERFQFKHVKKLNKFWHIKIAQFCKSYKKLNEFWHIKIPQSEIHSKIFTFWPITYFHRCWNVNNTRHKKKKIKTQPSIITHPPKCWQKYKNAKN